MAHRDTKDQREIPKDIVLTPTRLLSGMAPFLGRP